jgi:phosphoribosylformylglycinamidine synthase
VLGTATDDGHLTVSDDHFGNKPVDMDMEVLLGKPPKMTRNVSRRAVHLPPFDTTDFDLKEAGLRVLRLPAVASKSFLITIGDRSVGGLTARDQMVGPWQVPVADVAVTAMGYQGTRRSLRHGRAHAAGLLDAPASGRMAVGEAITNLAAADVGDSATSSSRPTGWRRRPRRRGRGAVRHRQGRRHRVLPALGVAIPVGKDSLSMRTAWEDGGGQAGHGAAVADRHRLRPGARRAQAR